MDTEKKKKTKEKGSIFPSRTRECLSCLYVGMSLPFFSLCLALFGKMVQPFRSVYWVRPVSFVFGFGQMKGGKDMLLGCPGRNSDPMLATICCLGRRRQANFRIHRTSSTHKIKVILPQECHCVPPKLKKQILPFFHDKNAPNGGTRTLERPHATQEHS